MIRTFHDKATATLFLGRFVRSMPPSIQPRALDKLRILHAAMSLDDLRAPPGNRLEPLKGDREGQWSIRINAQWRLCFRWEDGDAYEVEITDYHRG